MDEDGRDRVVVEVADALTLDQDVDWDRRAREAAPASRRTLDNLRLVAGLLADFRGAGRHGGGVPACPAAWPCASPCGLSSWSPRSGRRRP